MVVECNKCSTRFQLDSAKIPDSGIRVRCSRCKHAFFLQHPSHSRALAVDAVVEQAIKREGMAVPHSADGPSSVGTSDSIGMGAVQEASNDQGYIEDEDDWEFNEDPPPYDEGDHGDEQDEQVEEVDEYESIEVEGFDDDNDDNADDLGDRDDSENFEGNYAADGSDDAESDDFMSGGRDPDESGSIDLANDGPIGDSIEIEDAGLDSEEMNSDHLTSSNMGFDNALPKAVPLLNEDPGVEQGVRGARNDSFGSSEDFSAPMKHDSFEQAVPLVGADDQTSEDPENWDFFSDQANSQSIGLSSTPQPRRTPTGASASGAQSQLRPVHDSLSGGSLDRVGGRPVGAVERIASALAWVVFFGLLSSGVYLGVMASVDSGMSRPAFVSIGEMRAANIRGQWLETVRAGTLYVVTGDLMNPGSEARALSQAVQVSLIGEGGGELDVSPAFAGRDVEIDALREMSVEELWSSQRLTALALASDEIGPGQSASFTATFVALPEEASHFQLGAVAAERINETAAARGVPIPVAAAEVVLNHAELVLDPGNSQGLEVGDLEIVSELQAALDE